MNNPELLGKAILDEYRGRPKGEFIIEYPDLDPDVMPIEVFFREPDEMPAIEQYAISLVRGTVLDVGAGAGSHSLWLREQGFDVTSLDISRDCVTVMKERGLDKVVHADIFSFTDTRFDTLLLLMNGIGLAEDLEGLAPTLRSLQRLLNPGGQILFDSSDLSYLPERTDGKYRGEMEMRYRYGGEVSDWGKWLYTDPYKLIDICENTGIELEVIIEDDSGLYLSRVVAIEVS